MERISCVSTEGCGQPVDTPCTNGTRSIVSDDGFGPDPAGFLGDLYADAGADAGCTGFEHRSCVVYTLDAAGSFYAKGGAYSPTPVSYTHLTLPTILRV